MNVEHLTNQSCYSIIINSKKLKKMTEKQIEAQIRSLSKKQLMQFSISCIDCFMHGKLSGNNQSGHVG